MNWGYRRLSKKKTTQNSYWGLTDYVDTRIAVSITEHHHGHPAECAQSGVIIAPTALIYKYCFYLESSTQEDMEIKCFKQSWQPVAKKQTF